MFMSMLLSSVGTEPTSQDARKLQGPFNRRDDVIQVQRLLNKNLRRNAGFFPLREDGRCGPKTIAAIKLFQRTQVKAITPDGLVNRRGRTYSTLLRRSQSQSTPHVAAFIEKYSAVAQATAKKWKIPASVLLAQAAQESGWGAHAKDNAFFGIKGKSHTGKSTSFRTSEFVNGKKISITDSFRAYRDFSESADDYGRFLTENPRYKSCFKQGINAEQFVHELSAAGYATDPRYAEKIIAIIQKHGLTQYDN
jgi:type VI secretion system secreted protein VgrG